MRLLVEIRGRLGSSLKAGALSRHLGTVASMSGFLLLAVTAGEAVVDQVDQLPPPPPKKAEAEAALPRAQRVWSEVEPRLAAKLASDRPLEIGEVWATRRFRICGYANARAEAVDNMEPFFTFADGIKTKADNVFVYVVVWQQCIKDRWVEIHPGTERTGPCGSSHFRRSILGKKVCAEQDLVSAVAER